MADLSDHNFQQELLAFGDDLVSQTRELIRNLWQNGTFLSQLKEDNTPVSEIDLKCEELARDRLQKKYPHHGIIGEEYGTEKGEAEFVWTIDPIDGTQNLVNQIPTFGTILGLLYQGQPVLGWLDFPILGDRLRGGVNCGTYYNGKPVQLEDLTSDELSPTDLIATNCPATFQRGDNVEDLWKILRFHPHSRIYYDVYAHNLAIRGAVAVMVEYNLKIWDLAATQALIKGAGGIYRELGRIEESGQPTRYHVAFGKSRAVELVAAAISG
ncbi:MAG: inositol monophosphatase family protein [Leptolyngbyaceae cyanobacterium]